MKTCPPNGLRILLIDVGNNLIDPIGRQLNEAGYTVDKITIEAYNDGNKMCVVPSRRAVTEVKHSIKILSPRAVITSVPGMVDELAGFSKTIPEPPLIIALSLFSRNVILDDFIGHDCCLELKNEAKPARLYDEDIERASEQIIDLLAQTLPSDNRTEKG